MTDLSIDWAVGSNEKPTQELIDAWQAIKPVVSKIDEGLYVSGFPDLQVQFQLVSRHITHVVSLTHTVPDLNGYWIFRWPFTDHATQLPNMQTLDHIAGYTAQLIEEHKSVLIHCAYGLNRSPLLAGMVLKRLHPEWTGTDIIAQITANRPHTLHNKLFRTYLLGL